MSAVGDLCVLPWSLILGHGWVRGTVWVAAALRGRWLAAVGCAATAYTATIAATMMVSLDRCSIDDWLSARLLSEF